MEELINHYSMTAKMLLLGYKPELVNQWINILIAWPNKRKVNNVMRKYGYKNIRYFDCETIVPLNSTYRNRINIFFNENNMISAIREG